MSPRLSFDHYVATEAGYDGGNVKYSLNGGDFAVIPADAYLFNGPRVLATAAEGSTNPLAGEDGFTGTDGGKVTGSWGQSQVDLEALGARGWRHDPAALRHRPRRLWRDRRLVRRQRHHLHLRGACGHDAVEDQGPRAPKGAVPFRLPGPREGQHALSAAGDRRRGDPRGRRDDRDGPAEARTRRDQGAGRTSPSGCTGWSRPTWEMTPRHPARTRSGSPSADS